MCMIAVKIAGARLPKKKHLHNGWTKNQDGTGVAIVKADGSGVHIKKGFGGFKPMWRYLKENSTIDDIVIVHFRYATQGLTDGGNCHPFPISKLGDTLREEEIITDKAMAHNGVISSYSKSYFYSKTKEEESKYSDTQLFVMDILTDDIIWKGLLEANNAICTLVDEMLGGDRLVVFNKALEMQLLGDWEEEGDILYSNTAYKAPKFKASKTVYTTGTYKSNAYNAKDNTTKLPIRQANMYARTASSGTYEEWKQQNDDYKDYLDNTIANVNARIEAGEIQELLTDQTHLCEWCGEADATTNVGGYNVCVTCSTANPYV